MLLEFMNVDFLRQMDFWSRYLMQIVTNHYHQTVVTTGRGHRLGNSTGNYSTHEKGSKPSNFVKIIVIAEVIKCLDLVHNAYSVSWSWSELHISEFRA